MGTSASPAPPEGVRWIRFDCNRGFKTHLCTGTNWRDCFGCHLLPGWWWWMWSYLPSSGHQQVGFHHWPLERKMYFHVFALCNCTQAGIQLADPRWDLLRCCLFWKHEHSWQDLVLEIKVHVKIITIFLLARLFLLHSVEESDPVVSPIVLVNNTALNVLPMGSQVVAIWKLSFLFYLWEENIPDSILKVRHWWSAKNILQWKILGHIYEMIQLIGILKCSILFEFYLFQDNLWQLTFIYVGRKTKGVQQNFFRSEKHFSQNQNKITQLLFRKQGHFCKIKAKDKWRNPRQTEPRHQTVAVVVWWIELYLAKVCRQLSDTSSYPSQDHKLSQWTAGHCLSYQCRW